MYVGATSDSSHYGQQPDVGASINRCISLGCSDRGCAHCPRSRRKSRAIETGAAEDAHWSCVRIVRFAVKGGRQPAAPNGLGDFVASSLHVSDRSQVVIGSTALPLTSTVGNIRDSIWRAEYTFCRMTLQPPGADHWVPAHLATGTSRFPSAHRQGTPVPSAAHSCGQSLGGGRSNEEHHVTDIELTQQLGAIDAMFVQVAPAAATVDGRLVLKNVAESTLFFSDRPQRVVGHMHTAQLVSVWDDGENSFAADPPNAVLAFVGGSDAVPSDIVLEISDPVLAGSDLSYAATVLDGTLPATAGACTLFIDPFGNPASAVSLAGMNRRDRRRDRR